MRNDLIPGRSVASLFAMIAVSGASAPAFAAPGMIFTNGNVITMEKAQPKAEAVAVENDKIVFVGTSAEAQKLAPP